MNEEVLQAETMADLEEHFDDASPWNRIADYLDKGTVLPVKVEGVVKGGVIAIVEGIRGFIPASHLSLSYVENLESYLLQDIEVQVIEADQAENRLVLSARGLLKAKEKAEKDAHCKCKSRIRSDRCRGELAKLRRICASGERPFRTDSYFSDF